LTLADWVGCCGVALRQRLLAQGQKVPDGSGRAKPSIRASTAGLGWLATAKTDRCLSITTGWKTR
jgi:hypothetical protein